MKLKRGSFVLKKQFALCTPLPKGERIRENRMQKTRASVLLADICVKVALEAGAGACAKPIKFNRLFSDNQEKS
jgi:hypothetical protein